MEPDAGIDAPVDVPPDGGGGSADLVTEEGDHDFSDVVIGEQSAALSLVVRNAGTAASAEIAATLTGDHASDFELVTIGDGTDCAGRTLEPNATCLVQLRFVPSAAGARTGALRVSATGGGAATVGLSGNGLSPGNLQITVGESLVFGANSIQSTTSAQTITVRNSGGAATAALTVSLGDSTNYAKVTDECHGAPLAGGATCSIQVRFNPTVVGSLPTQVSIRESETVGVSASVQGAGSATLAITTTPGGVVTSDPTGITCGQTCTATFTQTPVTLTADAADGYAFDGWDGACVTQGTTTSCAVALTQPTTTAGTFFRAWECTPDTIVCDDTAARYVACTPDGRIDVEMDCPLGCASNVEKCLDVVPSVDANETSLTSYLDQADTGPVVTLSGAATIDTNTGAVTDGASGTLVVPHDAIDGKRVFRMRSLHVEPGATVKVTGALPIVVLVDGLVLVEGVIDLSADGAADGPGIRKPAAAACDGGSFGMNVSYLPGGGGGSRASTGGHGGYSASAGSPSEGTLLDDPDLRPLQGGCRGGTSIDSTSSTVAEGVCKSLGGGAGGAIQIVSRDEIRITGKVDAGGGGGRGMMGFAWVGPNITFFPCAGGGGGSGGAVLLEAPSVKLTGSGATIATEGGGGAAGGSGAPEQQGQDGDAMPGSPAGGASGSDTPGGGKGATSTSDGAASGHPATGTQNGGGGGGGLGQLRVNTQNGSFVPQPGTSVLAKSSVGTVAQRTVP